MGEGEQGLPARAQAQPSGAENTTVFPQAGSEEAQGRAGHVDAGRADKHRKPRWRQFPWSKAHLPEASSVRQANCPSDRRDWQRLTVRPAAAPPRPVNLRIRLRSSTGASGRQRWETPPMSFLTEPWCHAGELAASYWATVAGCPTGSERCLVNRARLNIGESSVGFQDSCPSGHARAPRTGPRRHRPARGHESRCHLVHDRSSRHPRYRRVRRPVARMVQQKKPVTGLAVRRAHTSPTAPCSRGNGRVRPPGSSGCRRAASLQPSCSADRGHG